MSRRTMRRRGTSALAAIGMGAAMVAAGSGVATAAPTSTDMTCTSANPLPWAPPFTWNVRAGSGESIPPGGDVLEPSLLLSGGNDLPYPRVPHPEHRTELVWDAGAGRLDQHDERRVRTQCQRSGSVESEPRHPDQSHLPRDGNGRLHRDRADRWGVVVHQHPERGLPAPSTLCPDPDRDR